MRDDFTWSTLVMAKLATPVMGDDRTHRDCNSYRLHCGRNNGNDRVGLQ